MSAHRSGGLTAAREERIPELLSRLFSAIISASRKVRECDQDHADEIIAEIHYGKGHAQKPSYQQHALVFGRNARKLEQLDRQATNKRNDGDEPRRFADKEHGQYEVGCHSIKDFPEDPVVEKPAYRIQPGRETEYHCSS